MAVSISSSSLTTTTKDISKEHGSLRKSSSGKDLCARAGIRRSNSDNHICYSINHIRATSTRSKMKNSHSVGIFPFQLSSSIIPNSLWSFIFDSETSKQMDIVEKTVESDEVDEVKGRKKRANWVERILELRAEWKTRQLQEESKHGDGVFDGDGVCNGDGIVDEDGDEGVCEVDYGEGEEEEEEEAAGGRVSYNRESFSRLLARVPRSDIRHFSQMAFLCNMAYVIPEIKDKDLGRQYPLKFVTSSLEKKAEAAAIKAKFDQNSTRVSFAASAATESSSDKAMDSQQKRLIRHSAAYEIAASAASYVQSRAEDLLSPSSEPQEEACDADPCGNEDQPQAEGGNLQAQVYKSEVAAYVTATTMTAVVAAGEKEKQAAARDLQSLHSSPCEWFVCDDSSTYTRCFVIQGSDSLASWQANLFFEPTKFEGTEGLVHRGIYEAAKGIYEQFMPEIMDHLNKYGDRAKLQFTGHSLGGSLSLLVNLMLLARKVVKPSALRPVVTFGSPFVFCGAKKILQELGLDENHVHCVMMHRDIVPRAFSCNYPQRIAQLLKRLNGTFRSHPCLNKNKLLYAPMGKIFILQPDEKSSPHHPLLPPGSALYSLANMQCGSSASALRTFLNNPHPLVILSDPTAYGSEGSIHRDHDSSNYLKAVNGVLREHTKMVVQKVREQRKHDWQLLPLPSPHTWSREDNLENTRLLSNEVMTGV
ncbi:hypothetical protein L1049_014406 [Liquidambar formosana]|uniref:Fungal lipase-type domain-containing protein n=1 Tax=Liquidambar formosana TaxID=63359 RepID=A0AAP0RN76_LIQFO